MSPDPKEIIEGTGEEVSKYASAHPKQRFRLLPLPPKGKGKRQPSDGLKKAIEIIESFRGRIPVLPDEAYSTDSIYE